MLYLQNGDRIVTTDSVTSLRHLHTLQAVIICRCAGLLLGVLILKIVEFTNFNNLAKGRNPVD